MDLVLTKDTLYQLSYWCRRANANFSTQQSSIYNYSCIRSGIRKNLEGVEFAVLVSKPRVFWQLVIIFCNALHRCGGLHDKPYYKRIRSIPYLLPSSEQSL